MKSITKRKVGVVPPYMMGCNCCTPQSLLLLFSPPKVAIENLGDTAQSEYKHGSSLNTESSGSDSYRDILTSHKTTYCMVSTMEQLPERSPEDLNLEVIWEDDETSDRDNKLDSQAPVADSDPFSSLIMYMKASISSPSKVRSNWTRSGKAYQTITS
ncbi:uncharacterized protein [Apostichopus japonicus]|uniref:uncharacterized protein n=1 Tax=Stichopus japonicus TaxID=307972 RepID=UPI003AB3C130